MAKRHYRVTVDSETGKATGAVIPIGLHEETDIGDQGHSTHHLVLAEGSGEAMLAAEEAHAISRGPAYPKRTKAAEVTEVEPEEE